MKIEQYRKKIDLIDEKIIGLLCKREKITQRIGEIKKEQKIKVLDNNRELKQNNYYSKCAKNKSLCEKYVVELFDVVRKHSKKKQKEIK